MWYKETFIDWLIKEIGLDKGQALELTAKLEKFHLLNFDDKFLKTVVENQMAPDTVEPADKNAWR